MSVLQIFASKSYMLCLPSNCMSLTRTGFVGHGVNTARSYRLYKYNTFKTLESRYSFLPGVLRTGRPVVSRIQLSSSALRRSIANSGGIRVSALNRFSRVSRSRVTVYSASGSVCNSNSFQKTQLQKKDFSGYKPYLRVNKFSTLSSRKMLEKKPFERLNKNVVPQHYALELKPNLNTLTFEGKTSVKIEVAVATDTITLHALDLAIKSANLVESTGKVLTPTITYSIEDETATFKFPQNLSLGQNALNLEFTGELNDKMKGFYRSKYVGPDGKERFAAVTQFEATDARRCFPCWDEPAIKATFDITLVVPEDRVALSNMTIKEETTNSGFRTIQFNTTPIMSTYLVAVVVGEYDYIEDVSDDGVTVRVYTPKGKKEQGQFALEVATKVLPYYKEYFKIAYPLPKIDLIAISDFSAGAMENWGLVTYRETAILIDPENSSAVSKQWVALVVGHELAHQWFGNLVTMEWWSDLWLNEGYASFVEFLCVNHIFPEYDIWTQFVTDTLIRALELDCLESSHAIEVPVGHPSEVDEIFDEISYNKGASVIRMLHKYIGDDDFRKGMNLYLTRHQYGNTITTDLWSALEEASGKPVGAVMSTWTKQMGFPLVRVEGSEDSNARILTLKQEKFCASGCKDSAETQWIVPISISTSKKPDEVALTTVLDKRSTEVRIENVSKNEWVKVNPGTVGYYRVQYPPEMLAQFEPAIRDLSMPPLDRLGLLDDLFAMVKAGHSPTVQVLKLLEAFTQETNYTVWASISNCFSKLSDLISHTDLQPQFDKYARKLFTPIATRLGWDPKPNESHLDTLLRSLVLNRMVAYDDPDTIEEATRRFNLHVNEKAPLLADLRNVCYRAVLKNSNEEMLDKVMSLYRTVDLHEEKVRILRSLGVMKDKTLLEKVLQFGISDEVRAQDIVFCVIPVSMNPAGRELAWKFFQDNSKMFLERYQGGFLIAQLVRFSTQNFATESKAKEIEDFFKLNPMPGTERTVQQSAETIRLTASWLNRDLPGITDFLNVSYKD